MVVENPHAKIRELSAQLGQDMVLCDRADLARYSTDAMGDHLGQPLAVLRPGSTADVQRIVSVCSRLGLGIVPMGGNTGLVSGATTDARNHVIVSLERMNCIRSLNATNLTATVEAGMVLESFKAELTEHSLDFAVALGSQGSCQIGGIISTNAGGTNVLRYGMTRAAVLGLEVVMPSGEVFSSLGGLHKDNRGPNLGQLFIGAEGIFGIVTAASLRLMPASAQTETALVAAPDFRTALQLLQSVRSQAHEVLTGFEAMSRRCLPLARLVYPELAFPLGDTAEVYVLIEFSAVAALPLRELTERILTEELSAGRALDVVLAQNEAQRRRFWQIREGIVAGHVKRGYHVRSDVSVRLEQTPELVERLEAMLAQDFQAWTAQSYGHMGDGNLHFVALPPATMPKEEARLIGTQIEAAIYAIVEAQGGSISAEHGIGRSKSVRFHDTTPEPHLHLLRAIKQALDPTGLMNPGCIISAET
jgi:FAD/FMN-containing dehydrogenase